MLLLSSRKTREEVLKSGGRQLQLLFIRFTEVQFTQAALQPTAGVNAGGEYNQMKCVCAVARSSFKEEVDVTRKRFIRRVRCSDWCHCHVCMMDMWSRLA